MRHLTWIQLAVVLGALTFGVPALAHEDHDDDEAGNLAEARMEGQVWTTFMLNEHLNPFELKVDVDNSTAILEGDVDRNVNRELAEQIALSVDGIDDVDNRIEVVKDLEVAASDEEEDRDRSFGDRVSDATTTASVKSKLLWNRDTAGLSINVSTENGVVELEGEADSEASKELAGRLAANTDGVRDVVNRIEVMSGQQAQVN